jgi:hypothetical protein
MSQGVGGVPPDPSISGTSGSRTRVYVVVLLAALVGLSLLMYLFQPWALFTTKTVNESLPYPTPSVSYASPDAAGTVTNPPAVTNVLLATGKFRSYEHPTSGTASLIHLPDGGRIIRLTDFETDNGPDVKVWVSKATAGQAGDARDFAYVDLGDMKGNVGNQNYELPAAAKGETWNSVIIWCDRFSVPFGAAPLNPEPPQLR